MIPVTTTMVTVTQRQHSCGVQRIAKNLILQRLRNLDSILELMRITTFKIANLLIGLGSLMICTHDVTTLTKRKEMTRYCKSFRYGGKCALGKRFYRSNGVSVPTENGLNIPIMGFSLTSPYNRRCHAPVTSVNTFANSSRARACRIMPASNQRLGVKGQSYRRRGAGQSAARDREVSLEEISHHQKACCDPAG
jgi:hypothetical protein